MIGSRRTTSGFMSILTEKGIPELLCPAGDFTRLKAAVDFGADAVYLAGKEFGMRTASANFNTEELEQAVAYAHNRGVKVHVTCNTVPHNEEMERLPDYLALLNRIGVDAVIAGDLGTMDLVERYAPSVELHASVQAGVCNYRTAEQLYCLGASRVVLARELSLKEIREIRQKTSPQLELECFVHGAMCISYSGRCLLSSYMTGRDANRGDCAQPCRWSYSLMEEKRPGQFFDITEDEKGTYILNANDLCLAEQLDQLRDAGVDSLKIEGRAKSHYYVAVTANAYRGALDSLKNAEGTWKLPRWVAEELEKISHRTYSTGFLLGRPENGQTYQTAGYIRDYAVAAVVNGFENGFLTVIMKNKFYPGQEFDCLIPGGKPVKIRAGKLFDENGESIESASHPMMIVRFLCEIPLPEGTLLRMKTE